MKIDVVCFAGNSGLGHYAISLARALQSCGNDVRIVTSTTMPSEVAAQFSNVTTPFRKTRTLPIDYIKVLLAILRRRPDVILVQSWKAPVIDVLLVRLLRLFGIRSICTVHDVAPHHPQPWSKFDIPFFFKAFDGLVVHSREAAARLEKIGCGGPSVVIPHGVYDIFDTLHMSVTQARLTFADIHPTDFVVLFFGHLDERKGILEFLAAAQALSAHTDIKFLVAGNRGPSRRVAQQLDIVKATSSNVKVFDGYVPFADVQRYFAAADLVVTPYREGSTSGVLKLAIAFKRPILSTDIGDARETIESEHGLIGKILSHTDVAGQMCREIRTIQAEKQKYAAPLDAVAADLSWEKIGRKYSEFAQRLHAI